jgi:hypothetical protein
MSKYCCENFYTFADEGYIADGEDGYYIAVQSIDNSTWVKVESKEDGATRDAYTVEASLAYIGLEFCLFCGVKLGEDK